MNNIFENTYFGKVFKTRNGRKAIFYKGVFTRARKESNYVTLLLEESDDLIQGFHTYKLDGTAHDGHTHLDIISEWNNPIDEEELDELAMITYPCRCSPDEKYCDCCINPDLKEAFKRGYKIAFNDLINNR